MKALIIDDEPLARSIVKEYLQHYPQIALAQECNDGFAPDLERVARTEILRRLPPPREVD